MTEGDRFTNGVRALLDADFTAPQDTTLVARYRRAGLLIVGRTNTPELGILPTTEPLAFGATRNPWAPERSPGGSSGGSASAVASGMVPASHASDGGGSIRIPASCCGLVGLKVSQGRMSLGPFRSETALGVEHVVTRTVRDTAGLLDATHGPGVGDTVIAPAPVRPYVDEVGAPTGVLRIGLLTTLRRSSVHPECQEAASRAAALLTDLGHHVEEGEPDALQDESLVGAFGALWAAQTRAGVLAVERWLGRPVGPDDVEPLTWALAERAKALSADEYVASLAAIASYRRAVHQWWADGWDLLLTPTLADVPPMLGEMAQDADNPYAPFVRAGQLAVFTPAFNTTGQPAISLPTHWSPDRPAGRRPAGRGLRAGGCAVAGGGAARGGGRLVAASTGGHCRSDDRWRDVVTVDRDRRAALIALRLSDGGIEKLKWLYRGLEAGGAREAKQILAPGYREVVLLSGPALTGNGLVDAITRLTTSEDIDAVDVILVAHGLNGRLQFSQGDVCTAADLATQLRAAGAAPKLRLLYSSACFGATHAEQFLGAGFLDGDRRAREEHDRSQRVPPTAPSLGGGRERRGRARCRRPSRPALVLGHRSQGRRTAEAGQQPQAARRRPGRHHRHPTLKLRRHADFFNQMVDNDGSRAYGCLQPIS